MAGVERKVKTAAYGPWRSPISAELVSASSRRLEGFALDSHNRLLWLETRPSDSGRGVLVREEEKEGEDPVDITPEGFSVRSTAQEYGGGAFCTLQDSLIFCNDQDQRLYKQSILFKGSAPVPLTPNYGGPVVRYADGVVHERFNRYITVLEDHRGNIKHPSTEIVAVSLHGDNTQEPKLLVSGNDFYAFPRVDRKGGRMAWIEWAHPNMPWDRAELWVGYISENGDVYKRICIAGGDPKLIESPSEPKWSSERELFFVSDRKTGFWNIYKWKNGISYLGIIDEVQNSLSVVDVPINDLRNIITGDHFLYIEGASTVNPSSLLKVNLNDDKSQAVDVKIIWSCTSDMKQYEPYISHAELIKFSSGVDDQYAYAYFYPPCNPDYVACEGEKPPLLHESHGGPTDEARGSLNLNIQYWTSRGWAFVDVNYGGSSGYGREYRERLIGSWGIVDVVDCCNCAKFLVESGKVNGNRLCITGCSAGGYTTLASLAFKETFKAGSSLFGARSDDALHERSPINFVDNFSCPIIIFQGLEDTVVHPQQARKIYTALKEKGLPVALVEYEGEPHGFRKSENLKCTLEQQMVFFACTVGGFTVADQISPMYIDNFG